MTHVSHLRRTPNDLARDLRRAKQVIEDAGGEPAPLYRPPYGVFSLGSWRECTKQHWERVLWSRWGKDWEETGTPRGIADNIGQPAAGDILLLHDSDRYSAPNSWKNTLGALPIILDRIAQAGLVARPVGELLHPAVLSVHETISTEPAAATETAANPGVRGFAYMLGAIFAAYVGFAIIFYFWKGEFFTPDPPDSWALLLLIGAVALGRWKSFLVDWIPFVALIFGYEMLRGFAGTVISKDLVPAHPGAVHYHFLLDFDSWLFGGTPLTKILQDKLYDPNVVHWYDGLAALVYSLHFALPLIFRLHSLDA